MLEIMGLGKTKGKYDESYSYDVDFAGKPIGEIAATDKSSNAITLFSYGNMGTPRLAGVEQHPTAGLCFHFNGNAGFKNDNMQALANFFAGSFDLEIGFVKTSAKGCFLFTTGNRTSGYNQNGVSVMINGTTADTIEFNMSNTSQGTSKVILAGLLTDVLQEVVIKKRKNSVEITNISTGATIKESPSIRNTADSYFALGTSNGGSSGTVFDGFLKYIRIKKFLE